MIETKDGLSIELRVAAGSPTGKVAGAIVGYFEDDYKVSMVAMGAGAVNQAVKAICIARGMAAAKGKEISCIPGYIDYCVGGVTKTAIKFFLEYK